MTSNGERRATFFRATGFLIIGRLPAFLVPFVLARVLGVNLSSDAFFLALSVATFFIALFQAIGDSIIVPFFARGSRPPSLARTLVIVAFGGGFAFGAAVWVLSFPLADVLTQDPTTRAALPRLLGLLVAYISLAAANAALSAILTARAAYGTAFIFAGLPPLVLVATLLALPSWGALSAVAGSIAGEALRFLALVVAARRTPQRGPVVAGQPTEIISAARSAVGQLVASGLFGLYPILDRILAAGVMEGGATILAYGERIWQIPVSLLTGGYLTVTLVEWSRLTTAPDGAGQLRRRMRRSLLTFFYCAIPCSGLLALSTPWIARWVAGPGIAEASIDELRVVLMVFFIVLPVFGAGLVLTRGYLARGHALHLQLIGIGGIALKAVLSFVLVERLGLAGLAIATAVMYTFTTVLMAAGWPRVVRA